MASALRLQHRFPAFRLLIQRPNRISLDLGCHNVSLFRWQTTKAVGKERTLEETGKRFTVPFNRSVELYGRTRILERLEETFKYQRRAALIGLDGIGKSAIAIAYAHKHLSKDPQASILRVQSSNAACFRQSYVQLADTLKLAGQEEAKVDILKLIYDHLSDSQNGPWLMILDDVDDRTLLSTEYARQHDSGDYRPLSRFLPQGPHGTILIASRDRRKVEDLIGSTSSIISVHALDDADSMDLLRERSGDKDARESDVNKLANCLDNHALALTQAATYISNGSPKINITKYLSLYRKRKAAKYQHTKFGSHTQAVSVTWQLAVDKIRKEYPASFELLCLMSVFHFDKIPAFLFMENMTRYKKDKNDWEKDIDPLLRFSLITRDGDKVSMHESVQQLTNSWLQANHSLHQIVREGLSLLSKSLPDISTSGDHGAKCHVLLPHAQAALSIDAGPENFSQRKRRGKLLYDVACFEYFNGDYAAALRHFVEAKYVQSEVLKEGDEELEQTKIMVSRLRSERRPGGKGIHEVDSEPSGSHRRRPDPRYSGIKNKTQTLSVRRSIIRKTYSHRPQFLSNLHVHISNPQTRRKARQKFPRRTQTRRTSIPRSPASNLRPYVLVFSVTLGISLSAGVYFTQELTVRIGQNEEVDRDQDEEIQLLEKEVEELNTQLVSVNGDSKVGE